MAMDFLIKCLESTTCQRNVLERHWNGLCIHAYASEIDIVPR